MLTSSKQEFAVEAEMEYKGLFASAGAYSSTKGGSEGKSEQKFMSTAVQALGGDQRIAAAVTDLYAPTFKNTLVVSCLLTYLFMYCMYICNFKIISGQKLIPETILRS
jgi:hypothetical protein